MLHRHNPTCLPFYLLLILRLYGGENNPGRGGYICCTCRAYVVLVVAAAIRATNRRF